jgi:phytanoyl-CoA hydroxylase
MSIPVITEKNHQEMAEQGYTLLENVFSIEEMDEVIVHIEAMQQKHKEKLLAMGGSDGSISRANEITFTDHLAENDPKIMEFVKRPEFVTITTAFLGPDTDLYWNQSVFKEAGGTKQFPWHQDDGYTEVDPAPYLTLWLALNDATVENGCVWVLPGSHKNGLLPHEKTPIGFACHSLDDPNQGVPVPVKAGSMAVFWSLTAHKSGLNVSNGPRKGYVIQFSKKGLRLVSTGELIQNLVPIAREGQPA